MTDERIMAIRRKPLSRTCARTVTPIGRNSPATGTIRTDTPAPNHTTGRQLGLFEETPVDRGGMEGKGDHASGPPDRQMAVRRASNVPEALKDFDRTLRQCRRYRPTERFYGALMADFVGVPGLDLAYEAEGMIEWLRNTPKGRARTDIPRTAINWLTNAKERAIRLARMAGNGHNRLGNGYNHAGRRTYGAGHATDEDREWARRKALEAESEPE